MEWQQVGPYQWRSEISSWDASVTPKRPLYRIYISGPRGCVTAYDLVWITGRLDYIESLYNEICRNLDGFYHCCFDGRSGWV